MAHSFFRRIELVALVACFLLLRLPVSIAQDNSPYNQTSTISGKVVDHKTGEALPFANVFIDNTTVGAVTDLNGAFTLRNITTPGVYELVVSFVGYVPFKQKISLLDDDLILPEIELLLSATELNTVEVKGTRDAQWEKKLRRFTKIFLGEDKAVTCTIINPWVVDFPKDSTKKFRAVADVPIEIENKTLGYKITFYLTNFLANNTTYLIEGNARFEELKSPDESERAQWELNRNKFYQRSRQHLFKSIVDHQINGEGFKLYTETPGYEDTFTRSSYFYSELNKSLMAYDTTGLVISTQQKDIYRIAVKGRMEVHYTKERASVRPYRDVFGPVSWITTLKDFVLVNKNGVELTPADITVSGAMSADRVSHMMPLNYLPEKKQQLQERQDILSLLEEKIYVHTDKPYYYPGEALWFKGYVNYATPAWRDSLSQTCYVELIDPEKKMLMSKILKIDSGFFHNDFILPDTLKAGNYYLRAYTNFNRNYGDSNLYVKQIPLLSINDKVNFDQNLPTLQSDSTLSITSDKKIFKLRDKISITLSVKDAEGNPLAAHLSISVTDMFQVVPIHEHTTILNGFLFEEKRNLKDLELKYPVEYGFSFNGKFVNDNGKAEKTMLTVLQVKPRIMMLTEANESGIFSMSNLNIYDTATLAFKADKAKDNQYGKVELLPREIPPMNFKDNNWIIPILKTQTHQRIISDYEVPKDVRMLEGVEVRASRIPEEYQKDYRVKRPYGKPDYVLKAKDITTGYGSLLIILQNKFPGLNVQQVNVYGENPKWIVSLQRGLSKSNGGQVLITINDNFVGGDPESVLSMIDPNTVESIELKKGINVLFGAQGGGGILAIYTKIGPTDNISIEPNFQLHKIQGYSKANNFRFPDYNNTKTDITETDYRSTIYWNPEVVTEAKTGATTLSFFAADLPGRYRIVAEGVTQNGQPVRCAYFLDVSSD